MDRSDKLDHKKNKRQAWRELLNKKKEAPQLPKKDATNETI